MIATTPRAAAMAHRFLLVCVIWCLFHGADDLFIDATSIKMDYLPIGHARVDPILSSDCVSDHVHTFYGPQSGVDPRRLDPDDPLELHTRLVNTPVAENTGNVEENKSLYWHPTVYRYDRATDTYNRAVMAQSSAYYVWRTGETKAFPNGFRMIGGYDTAQSLAEWDCVNAGPCALDDCYTESNFFPNTYCDELEVSMRLPSCWDGVSISSPPDHTSHVAYTNTGEFDGECPETHPIKVPQIHLFFRISPYPGGYHTFADGSGIFHSDYVSGWKEDFLQDMLDNCENEGESSMPNFFCEDILTYRDAPKCTDEETCDFADPDLMEKIRAFQPPQLLDVQGTIAAEETCQIVGSLPRGTCNGSLVDPDAPVVRSTNTCDVERYEFSSGDESDEFFSEDEEGSEDEDEEGSEEGSEDEDEGSEDEESSLDEEDDDDSNESNDDEEDSEDEESLEEDSGSGDGSQEFDDEDDNSSQEMNSDEGGSDDNGSEDESTEEDSGSIGSQENGSNSISEEFADKGDTGSPESEDEGSRSIDWQFSRSVNNDRPPRTMEEASPNGFDS